MPAAAQFFSVFGLLKRGLLQRSGTFIALSLNSPGVDGLPFRTSATSRRKVRSCTRLRFFPARANNRQSPPPFVRESVEIICHTGDC